MRGFGDVNVNVGVGWNESNQKPINLFSNKGINRSTYFNSYFSAIDYIIKSVSHINNVLSKMINYSIEVELIFVEAIRILEIRVVFRDYRCMFTTENENQF